MAGSAKRADSTAVQWRVGTLCAYGASHSVVQPTADLYDAATGPAKEERLACSGCGTAAAMGPIRGWPVLGGQHHVYECAAGPLPTFSTLTGSSSVATPGTHRKA